MTKIEQVELAIAQAAYPDVHPDFTDAGWRRMAIAAIEAMREPSGAMLAAAFNERKRLGLLESQSRPQKELAAMIDAALKESEGR